ncbi:MAG: SIS domain-containing protein, partial [Microbacterium sp.]
MTPSASRYLAAALDVCKRIEDAEVPQITAAAELIAESIAGGHRWWAFGTGHSHILAEELWGRAGGIAEVHAILEPSLMLHEGLPKSSAMERLPGLAGVLADVHGIA